MSEPKTVFGYFVQDVVNHVLIPLVQVLIPVAFVGFQIIKITGVLVLMCSPVILDSWIRTQEGTPIFEIGRTWVAVFALMCLQRIIASFYPARKKEETK